MHPDDIENNYFWEFYEGWYSGFDSVKHIFRYFLFILKTLAQAW